MPALPLYPWFDRASVQFLQHLDTLDYQSERHEVSPIRCLMPLCIPAATPSHCPPAQMTTAEFCPFSDFLLHHRYCRHLHVTSTTPIYSIQCPTSKKDDSEVEFTLQLGMCPYETTLCVNTDICFQKISWPHEGDEAFAPVGGNAIVIHTVTGYNIVLVTLHTPSFLHLAFVMIEPGGPIQIRTGSKKVIVPCVLQSTNFVVSFASADMIAVENWMNLAKATLIDVDDTELNPKWAIYEPVTDHWDFGTRTNDPTALNTICGTMGYLLAYGIHDRYPRAPRTVIVRSTWLDESNFLSPLDQDKSLRPEDWKTDDKFLADLHDLTISPPTTRPPLRSHCSRGLVPTMPYGQRQPVTTVPTTTGTESNALTTIEATSSTPRATEEDDYNMAHIDEMSLVSEEASEMSSSSTSQLTRAPILSLVCRSSLRPATIKNLIPMKSPYRIFRYEGRSIFPKWMWLRRSKAPQDFHDHNGHMANLSFVGTPFWPTDKALPPLQTRSEQVTIRSREMCPEHENDKFVLNQVMCLMGSMRSYLKGCFERKGGSVNFSFPSQERIKVHRSNDGTYCLRLLPTTQQLMAGSKPSHIFEQDKPTGDHGLSEYENYCLHANYLIKGPPVTWKFDPGCNAFVLQDNLDKGKEYCWRHKK